MFVEAFQFTLDQNIAPGRVTIGKFNGKYPSLAAASLKGGKVIIQSPHIQESVQKPLESQQSKGIQYLNFNQQIEALKSGALLTSAENSEQLFIGSKSNLQVYDVFKNKDIMFREVQQGVNCITFGLMSGQKKPLVFVGGNCAIQGYDSWGNQAFWTVTSDNTRDICLIDLDNDKELELLTGSNDFGIRAFKSQQLLFDINQTAKVTKLVPLRKTLFGYGLSSGSVGVYNKKSRVWRTRFKSRINALCHFDFDYDGVNEFCIGLQSGQLQIRNDQTGEIIQQQDFGGNAITSLHNYDYRVEGKPQLICTNANGKGFIATNQGEDYKAVDNKQQIINDRIMALSKKKQQLLSQISVYNSGSSSSSKKKEKPQTMSIPSSNLEVLFNHQFQDRSLVLRCVADKGTVVKSILVQSEQLYQQGGCKLNSAIPQKSCNQLGIHINHPKDISINLKVKAIVGQSYYSQNLFAFEVKVTLPKFYAYQAITKNSIETPKSYVEFSIQNITIKQIQKIIADNFLTTTQKSKLLQSTQEMLCAWFQGIRDAKALVIQARRGQSCTIRTDNIELASDLVQTIAKSLDIKELSSQANFPIQFSKMLKIITHIDELQATRTHFTGNIAEVVNNIKVLAVKAQDSRILSNYHQMKKYYARLQMENNALITEFNIRNNNHTELIKLLKELNSFIQRGSSLRCGTAQQNIIQLCRNSIKNNKKEEIIQIIKRGTQLI